MRTALALLLTASPAFADAPRVVTDIGPVHSLVSQVMAGVGEPDLLVDGATDPHAVQLKPSQARAVSSADLVVWTGPTFAPWLDRAVDEMARGASLSLLDDPSTHLRELDGEDHDEDHDNSEDPDHEEHEDHAEHDDHGDDHAEHDPEAEHSDGHDHANLTHDPHAWLSPENGKAWLVTIADELSEVDPDNAATYQANAQAAVTSLAERDAAVAEMLAPFADAHIITFHDAFGYFADHYDLTIIGSVRPGDASAPSAAALSQLKATVAAEGVDCLFAEPAYDPALLATVSTGAAVETGTLNPVGSNLTPGPDLYGNLIAQIGENIAACLSR